MTYSVQRTKELKRILALPRRRADDDYSELARELTALLRTPTGTMTLRPVQALALHDIGTHRGGFLPIGVGEGKTLIFALAAWLLDAKNPIGLLPAGLMRSMKTALEELRRHWLIPSIFLHSYEMLGRSQASDALAKFEPDAIICDEVHRLKNLDAACTRRVARLMAKNPEIPFVAMSGTIMSDSIHDFAPVLFWCLKENAPLPFDANELDTWAEALAEPKPSRFGEDPTPPEPGALLDFCTPEELNRYNHLTPFEVLTAARIGFRRRLVETPGVVATAGDGENVGAALRIRGVFYELAEDSNARFKALREAMLTPDAWELKSGVDVWRHAQELALGFHSIWTPRPEPWWLEPRKKWNAFVRAYLGCSRTLDSPEQVQDAVARGRIDDGGLLAKWLAVRDVYEYEEESIWHDDSVLRLCAEWGRKPGIIWTSHEFFAERLAETTGLPYFGAQGLDASGLHIEKSTSPTIIASIDANKDGKNLQGRDPSETEPNGWRGWSRNLLVGPPDGWKDFQQCVARTHRPFQRAPEVTVDILIGCREHISAWRKIVSGTQAARDTVGGTPKLHLAKVDFPEEDELDDLHGSRW